MKTLLALPLFRLASRLRAAEPAASQLIGNWRDVDGYRSANVPFRGNGTFAGTLSRSLCLGQTSIALALLSQNQ